MESALSPVESLEQKLGANWPQLKLAGKRAEEKRSELHEALAGIDSDDTSVVVLGHWAGMNSQKPAMLIGRF